MILISNPAVHRYLRASLQRSCILRSHRSIDRKGEDTPHGIMKRKLTDSIDASDYGTIAVRGRVARFENGPRISRRFLIPVKSSSPFRET